MKKEPETILLLLCVCSCEMPYFSGSLLVPLILALQISTCEEVVGQTEFPSQQCAHHGIVALHFLDGLA